MWCCVVMQAAQQEPHTEAVQKAHTQESAKRGMLYVFACVSVVCNFVCLFCCRFGNGLRVFLFSMSHLRKSRCAVVLVCRQCWCVLCWCHNAVSAMLVCFVLLAAEPLSLWRLGSRFCL